MKLYLKLISNYRKVKYRGWKRGHFVPFSLSADKPLTADERAIIMRDLNIMHDEFVRVVASNRKLPIEQVKALADGSSLPGELSLEAGLIDAIGGLPEAQAYLEGLIAEPVSICW